MKRSARVPVALAGGMMVALVLSACSGGEKAASSNSATASASASQSAAPAGSTSAAATAAALPTPMPGTPPTGATPQMAALGDSIFHGLAAGGLCFTCHGADAKGTALAPDLTAPKKWLTGDGSFAFIQTRVTDGMPKPTAPYAAPMLPMGGAKLTPAEIKAVASYVYSISHTGK